MRLSPAQFFYASNPREAIEKSAESSRTTHGVPTVVRGCRYLRALIVGAVKGVGKEDLLSQRFSPLPGYCAENPLASEIDEIPAGSFKRRSPPEIQGSGYVVKSPEAALLAFHHGTSLKEGCPPAVNLGDDADTTGAAHGQIAGALHGEKAIPKERFAKPGPRKLIESFALKSLPSAKYHLEHLLIDAIRTQM